MLFFLVFKPDSDRVLLVRRRPFLGLPGSWLGESESVEGCASRAFERIAIVRSLGEIRHIAGSEDHSWDDKPAAISVFALVGADIVAPMSESADWYSIDRTGQTFDITIDLVRQFREKIPMVA